MIGRLPARTAYLLGGATAAVVVTWVLPGWIVQPSVPSTVSMMNEADAAHWAGFHRTEAGFCFALNAVWCSAAVWLMLMYRSAAFRVLNLMAHLVYP